MIDDPAALQSHPPASISVSSDPGGDPTRQTGAFFPGAQHFVVTGGQFTSNITHPTPTVPSDFRRIPLGDVDLRNEIRLDECGVAQRRDGRTPVRRVYSAHIEGRQSDVTVAVYEGENAEENWKREVTKYSGLRRWIKCINQSPKSHSALWTVNSCGIYATVFHDELVPILRFIQEYRHSMIYTIYLYGYLTREFQDAENYLVAIFGPTGSQSQISNSAAWIRRSTGRLCVEPSTTSAGRDGNPLGYPIGGVERLPHIPMSQHGPNSESIIISSLTLNQCHEICFWYLAINYWSAPLHDAVRPGTIILSLERMYEIAHIPNMMIHDRGWRWLGIRDDKQDKPIVMEDGWTRFDSSCAKHGPIGRVLRPDLQNYGPFCWHSQANYIFSQVSKMAPDENYFFVWWIRYMLSFSAIPDELPGTEDGKFCRPLQCPAYWSLDPAGIERLSPEVASTMGFPTLEWKSTVCRKAWDARIYAGLSQFHAAKGFDPNSQDVARALGHPLFELSRDPKVDLAHIEEISSEDLDSLSSDLDCSSLERHFPGRSGSRSEVEVNNPCTTKTAPRPVARSSIFIIAAAVGIILAYLASVYMFPL
ncbi:hypothetical protein B0H13DRAFT_2059226 [Mycena leptocephala]|nr:hypothetical protein B0H13DRAFT_2059226 [Mycena leptocephala]